jgi:hypothetical protein
VRDERPYPGVADDLFGRVHGGVVRWPVGIGRAEFSPATDGFVGELTR